MNFVLASEAFMVIAYAFEMETVFSCIPLQVVNFKLYIVALKGLMNIANNKPAYFLIIPCVLQIIVLLRL